MNREELAQETAEYIANVLTPEQARVAELPGVAVHHLDDRRPPTDVLDIKYALLGGSIWISWMDDRVIDAMHALHGKPTGDVTHLIGDDWPPVAQPGCGVVPPRDQHHPTADNPAHGVS